MAAHEHRCAEAAHTCSKAVTYDRNQPIVKGCIRGGAVSRQHACQHSSSCYKQPTHLQQMQMAPNSTNTSCSTHDCQPAVHICPPKSVACGPGNTMEVRSTSATRTVASGINTLRCAGYAWHKQLHAAPNMRLPVATMPCCCMLPSHNMTQIQAFSEWVACTLKQGEMHTPHQLPMPNATHVCRRCEHTVQCTVCSCPHISKTQTHVTT